ncbi:hypothetical protein [Pedobacter miscanthi]|uniref:Uncharacterized protein n=1 Tax=Pedobacter miscanthi TaxID=2259170 RepID=A0A366KKL7_9SPHI|nr:hypothetical protein [Pedobacter miscanthi]RBQ02251.1 hypothetical protein DRW42_27620 [Pedobacter miscanthi]
MKKILLSAFIAAALIGCKKKNDTDKEPEKTCTTEFAMVSVKFTDKSGAGAEIKDITVINQRTGEKIQASANAFVDMVRGGYIVADDHNRPGLSESGDDLKVTATSVSTNQTKSATIKVSGGKSVCHINKISGPDQIAFD